MVLSDRASQIVADARRAYAPIPTDRVRVRKAIALRLVVGATVASGAASAGSVFSAVTSKVVVVGIAASSIVGAGAVAYEFAPGLTTKARHAEHQTAKPASDSTPSGAARAQGEPRPEVTADVGTEEQAVPKMESRARAEHPSPERGIAVAATSASTGRRPDVEAELVLLGNAQRALSSGDPSRALELTEQHARAFPTGALSEERRATRIVALCAIGRLAEGRSEGRAFLARSGTSPLAERVRTACLSKGDEP